MAKTKVTGGYIADGAINSDHLHTTLDLSTKTLTIGATTVSGHLIPDTNITYDLGSSSNRFRDIYLDGTTINLGGTELKKNSDGDIEFKSGSSFKRLVVSELEFDDGTNRKKFKISSGRLRSFDSSGVSDTADKISLSSNTTDDLGEGDNLYFTTARARSSFSASTGIAITDGAISAAAVPNASLTNSSVTINSNSLSLGGTLTLDTDDIGEGSTNLYFTNARARAAISVTGSGSYNSSTGVITVTGGVTSVNSATGEVTLDSDDISEGSSNLYFTNARARGAISVSGNALSYNSSTGVLTANYEESPSFTGNVTVSGTVDGRDIAADGTKLDGIESGATADQTQAEINALGITATGLSGTPNITVGTISSGAITSTGEVEATSFSDGTISGITFIDEDSFATNSATRVPTQQSIKAYVDAQVAGVVDTAPSTLNTLNELAAALGDDANFSTTTSTALGNRLRVDTASQGLTGTQQANAITNLGITATKAELNYVDGVTSNIQTQLDGKQASGSYLTGNQTITLSGDVSGSGTTSIAVTIADDSHTHDGRYFTETETSGFLHNTGLSNLWSGSDSKIVTFDYNSPTNGPGGWVNGFKSTHSNYLHSYLTNKHRTHDWHFGWRDTNAGTGTWVKAFHDDYHPNADTWTTARTITLGGDLSGSVSINGSANVTLTATVADDSHNHVISNVDGLQTALDAKAPIASPSFTTKITTPQIHHTSTISVLNGSSAQGMKVASLYVGTSYSNSAASGQVNTLNGYRVQGAEVINSSGNWVGGGNISEFTNNSGYITASNSAITNKMPLAGGTFTGGTTYNVAGNAITISSESPQIRFNDTTSGADDFWIHVNSNIFYILGDRDDSGSWETPHPLELHSGTNIGYTFGQRIFNEAYHPNADTWTTARTITLGGDLSGSVSINGSANVTLTATVADDSHNHVISNVDGLQTALDGKLSTSGTAANSQLLDSLDSTVFVYGSGTRKSTNSNPNSALNSGFYDIYQTNAPTSTWYSYITMAHTNASNEHGHQIAGSFYSDGDLYNRHYDGTTASFGNWTKIWNAANDGSGSGLDADLLDGLELHTGRNNEVNKVVRTDSNGYIQAGWINTTSGNNGTTAISRIYASQDEYIRYYTPANFGAQISSHINYNSLQNKPTIPTNNNQLTNGAGFLTNGSSETITYVYRIHSSDSTSPDSLGYDNRYQTFNYGVSSGVTGPLISFGGLGSGYPMQITGNYGGSGTLFKVRTRNGDTASWNPWRILWHDANDGSGSGLDADLLDGLDSTSFARKGNVGYQPYTDLFTFSSNSSGASTAGDQSSIQIYNGTAGNDAFMAFHVSADYAGYFGLDGTTNDLFWGGWSRGAAKYKIWHAANDGSGSGLDADTVDGIQGASFLRSDTADTYSDIRASGSTNTGRFISQNSWGTTHSTNGGYIQFGPANSSYAHIYTDRGNFYFNVNTLYANGNTMWHAGNDGAGSGLDADLLDGINSTGFFRQSGSWLGDLGSNGYTRENGLTMTGGSEFVILSKSGQGSVLIDGQYISYESNNGFFGSFNSSYGSASGIRATAADTVSVLQLDGGSANLAVTGDIYGKLVNNAYSNLYRFGGIYFTWDSDSYGTNFEHSITSSDGGSYGDHITLNSFGNVRINFDSNSNGTNYFRIGAGTTGTGNVRLTIDEAGNGTFAGNVTAYSDIRLKENIVEVDNALDKVCSMRGVYYNMIADETKSRRLGLVAQEVEKVLPEVVIEATPEEDKEKVLSVDYGNIVALLIEGMKEQQETIEKLTSRINDLEKGE